MAKFCTKCGKPLEEGKKCDCEKTTQKKEVKKEEVKKEEVKATVSSSSIDVKESLMDCVNVFKNIFTKPLDAIKEFVVENKFISGIIMIIACALATGVHKIAVLKNAYSSTSGSSFNLSDLSSLFSNGFSSAKPDYFKEFLNTSLTNLAEYAFIVVIGYLIISKLFKGTASIKEMVQAVAISLSIVIIGNLVNSVLVFIDGEFISNIRTYVSSFASVLSVLLLFASVKQVAGIEKNKLYITIASMSVLATACVDIVKKIFD